nr:hypothetical protein [Methylobacterium crusticola]
MLTEESLAAAVSAYLADPSQPAILAAGEHKLYIGAAVLAHPWAREVLARDDASSELRRGAVRTAVLLARPA